MFKRRKPGQASSPGPSRNPLAARLELGDDQPTVPLDNHSDKTAAPAGADSATRILPGSGPTPGEAMADPPVAVLLIIDGPGRGTLLPVGYGLNSVGRNSGERISIDFGDARISREEHARLIYDRESGLFYLQHGGGPNLTYLGDQPVLEPRQLRDRDRLRVGDTTLLFRTLCDEGFDWHDSDA